MVRSSSATRLDDLLNMTKSSPYSTPLFAFQNLPIISFNQSDTDNLHPNETLSDCDPTAPRCSDPPGTPHPSGNTLCGTLGLGTSWCQSSTLIALSCNTTGLKRWVQCPAGYVCLQRSDDPAVYHGHPRRARCVPHGEGTASAPGVFGWRPLPDSGDHAGLAIRFAGVDRAVNIGSNFYTANGTPVAPTAAWFNSWVLHDPPADLGLVLNSTVAQSLTFNAIASFYVGIWFYTANLVNVTAYSFLMTDPV